MHVIKICDYYTCVVWNQYHNAFEDFSYRPRVRYAHTILITDQECSTLKCKEDDADLQQLKNTLRFSETLAAGFYINWRHQYIFTLLDVSIEMCNRMKGNSLY